MADFFHKICKLYETLDLVLSRWKFDDGDSGSNFTLGA